LVSPRCPPGVRRPPSLLHAGPEERLPDHLQQRTSDAVRRSTRGQQAAEASAAIDRHWL
jgi:hypothetical protein